MFLVPKSYLYSYLYLFSRIKITACIDAAEPRLDKFSISQKHIGSIMARRCMNGN